MIFSDPLNLVHTGKEGEGEVKAMPGGTEVAFPHFCILTN